MSMDKPFRVEVEVDAPRDVVWRELTEPERIRHWFGWEYDGLDEEIKFIFVDHAKPRPARPDRARPGRHDRTDRPRREDGDPRDQAGRPRRRRWRDVYGDIEEGWITSSTSSGTGRAGWLERRTILRPARARCRWSRRARHESRYQRGATSTANCSSSSPRSDGTYTMLVTTYDLDDDEFAAAEVRWERWWAGRHRVAV